MCLSLIYKAFLATQMEKDDGLYSKKEDIHVRVTFMIHFHCFQRAEETSDLISCEGVKSPQT